MNRPRIELRHLYFFGRDAEPVGLRFEEGLNVLYGASNTGKSFTVKALDFMLGAKGKLPVIEQRQPYHTVLLGLRLSDSRNVTLVRAASGGGFDCFEGLHHRPPKHQSGLRLGQKHSPKNDDNVSMFLLNAIGMSGRQIVKNSGGEKDSLSFRNLAPFVLVDEVEIMAERSPILSGQFTLPTLEKNVFKFLLTGQDDSAVLAVPRKSSAKAAREGKVELINELLSDLVAEVDGNPVDRIELEQQDTSLRASIGTVHEVLKARQDELDALVKARRESSDALDELNGRIRELELTLLRFAKLDDVYASDIARLEGIEEGGGLLSSRLGRACPVCGALPENQTHTHGAEEITRVHKAALAELRRISRDRLDLKATINSLLAEAEGLRDRLKQIEVSREQAEKQIASLRPIEAQCRDEYEILLAARAEVTRLLAVVERRDELLLRRDVLDAPFLTVDAVPMEKGVDGTTAHDFAQCVQQVLEAWHFPGEPRVSYDLELQDIRVNGKERSANGKGVRALLHAAFKVAIVLFCRERGLPHPGFLVLDTPLLTYREPMKSRHGKLAPDEQVLAGSSLNEHFYSHLAGLAGQVQLLVIENSDPPASIRNANVEVFTGLDSTGRYGFFPSLGN